MISKTIVLLATCILALCSCSGRGNGIGSTRSPGGMVLLGLTASLNDVGGIHIEDRFGRIVGENGDRVQYKVFHESELVIFLVNDTALAYVLSIDGDSNGGNRRLKFTGNMEDPDEFLLPLPISGP